jgi:DNA-binding IclR family transcriptional regulator
MSARNPAARVRPTYFIESVDSALRLLHLLLETDRVRLSDAASELGVAPSTAHRLVSMLQYHGLAAQDQRTHEYMAGPDLVRFGLAASKQLDVRKRARPLLETLTDVVNETVHLGILQGANVLYIDSVEGRRLLRIGARVGASIPLHCVSMGKALLATLPRAAIDELYPHERLVPMTSRSIRTKTVLLKQLAIVRKRGFAHSCGESEDDVASIAAACATRDGGAVAVSLASPATRATRERINEWLPHLQRTVGELEKIL